MKMKIAKVLAMVLAMVCLFCFPVSASATAQGTDGTELEVIQPQNLEIQLGENWAGVEFELKTDAGMYPGVITVGEDGVLRLEIGGSENYILTCMNSTVEVPEPNETLPAAEGTVPVDESGTVPSETEEVTADPSEGTVPSETEADAEQDNTVAGIPVTHIALFGGGLVIAIVALIGIHFYQKRSGNFGDEEDDENDEI